jgi:hypothetical protein
VTNVAGRVLGDYRLESALGTGTLGETFGALNVRSGIPAAVKLVFARLTGDPDFADRFRRQLSIVSGVHADHVMPVTSYAELQRQYYIVTELATAGSLRGLLQRRATELPLWRGLEIVRQAALGLTALHAQSVWHGDMKPENILLESAASAAGDKPVRVRARVSDAGLTHLIESTATVGGNMAVGSPAYLSPEQCRGVKVDGRSDVYSLGLVLYEVVTGFPPFQIKTLGDAVEKHLHTAPPSPRSVVPSLPASLDALIRRCLAKGPDERFASASELASALEGVAQEVGAPSLPEIVLRAERPSVHARDDRPKVVLRDEPSARGAAEVAAPPPPPARVVFRPPGDGIGVPVVQPLAAAPGPAAAPADQMTAAELPPVNVVRRPTTPQLRPSALPPDSGDRGAGAGPARRSRRITIAVEPETLTLTPGVPTLVRVTVANTGHLVDHFPVTVEGVPDGWVEGPAKPAQLIPGARTTVPLKVLVPRACAQRAGEYHATVRVQSRDKPEESNAVDCRWTVQPFTASSVSLAPQRAQGWRQAQFQAVLANDGNAPANYALSAVDDEQKLRYTFVPPTASVEPCQRQTIAITAHAPIRWIGTTQSRPFTARVQRLAPAAGSPPTEPPVVAQGQFVHRPIIPLWVPPVLGALAVLSLLLWKPQPFRLTITPASVQLAIGSTVPLVAAVVNAKSEVAPNHPITWSSRDSTVARVTAGGVVTGQREGETAVIATTGRMETAIPVTVVAARVEAIAVTPKSLSLKIGSTSQLHATPKDGRGVALPRTVIWTTSDATVVTVGGDGRVTAKAPGSATITAMADNQTATADVTVPALAAGETPAGTDDCVAYDPAALRVVNEKGAGWGVSDGSKDVTTLDNQTDAQRAYALARAYKRHCYLGRANTRPDRSEYVIEYWDNPTGLPLTIDVEDCRRYQPTALRIVEVSGKGWALTDGKQTLTMADTQGDAKHAWDIARANGQLCFIGQGNRRPNHRDYVVQYWKL